MGSQKFKDFIFYLMDNGVTISGSYQNSYNLNLPQDVFIWDFHSNAKSSMYVVDKEDGIEIYGRYNFKTFIAYDDNFEDFMYEVLTVYRDDIMMYPHKDFGCQSWFKLMEEYKAI